MEGRIFEQLYERVRQLGKAHSFKGKRFSDSTIVITYLWAVLWDRPISWACRLENWPLDRLRSAGVLSASFVEIPFVSPYFSCREIGLSPYLMLKIRSTLVAVGIDAEAIGSTPRGRFLGLPRGSGEVEKCTGVLPIDPANSGPGQELGQKIFGFGEK